MALVAVSFALGFMGFWAGISLSGSASFGSLLGAAVFLTPALFVLEKIYRKTISDEQPAGGDEKELIKL